MGRGLYQRVDLPADHEGFTIFQQDVGIGKLHFAFAQGFDFPAFERDTGFESVVEKVIEFHFFVECDGGFTSGLLGFRHARISRSDKVLVSQTSPFAARIWAFPRSQRCGGRGCFAV